MANQRLSLLLAGSCYYYLTGSGALDGWHAYKKQLIYRQMAKRGQLLTLDQIESKLGYKVGSLENAEDDFGAFYSDLTAVSEDLYERALRELEGYRKQKAQETAWSYELLRPGESKVSCIGDIDSYRI